MRRYGDFSPTATAQLAEPIPFSVFGVQFASPWTTERFQVFWDNANHLYAISISAGKLYVFTATPTSVSQAPGSPHSIADLQSLIVLPKT